MVAEQVEEQVGVSTVELTLGFIRGRDRQRTLVGEVTAVGNAELRRTRDVTVPRVGRGRTDSDVVEAVTHLTVGTRHRQEVGEVTGVFRDVVHATEVRFRFSDLAANGAFTIDFGVVVALDFGLATGVEDREFELVTVERDRVDLDAPERIVLDLLDSRTRNRANRQRVDFAEFGEAVDEQAVTDDRATQFDDRRVAVGTIFSTVGRVHDGGAIVGFEIGTVAAQPIRRPVEVDRTEEVVRTRLRHGVDDTTGRATELGRITARLHFDRTIHVERHAGRTEVVVEVGDVQTVQVVRVFRDRRTADRREVTERAVALGRARCEKHHGREVAADRNRLDEFFDVDVQTKGRAREVAEKLGAGDDDRIFCSGAAGDDDIDVGVLRGEKAKAFSAIQFTTAAAENDEVVVTSRNGRETEATVSRRRRRTGEAEVERHELDGHTGSCIAAFVLHGARKGRRRIILSSRRRRDHRRGGKAGTQERKGRSRRAQSCFLHYSLLKLVPTFGLPKLSREVVPPPRSFRLAGKGADL